jgi:hypothetical protein
MSTTKTFTVKTGREWLGYRNGRVVLVFRDQYIAESYLQARRVEATAPVAQRRGTEAEFIGTTITVEVAK